MNRRYRLRLDGIARLFDAGAFHGVAGKRVARKNARHARCTRPARRAASTHQDAGTNKLSFAGRMSPRSKLKPGRYKLTVGATAFGLAATSRAIRFTIGASEKQFHAANRRGVRDARPGVAPPERRGRQLGGSVRLIHSSDSASHDPDPPTRR